MSAQAETLTIESAHGGDKFSQHVLPQVMRSGGCYDEPCCLLAGLAAAHDVAARVVARCEQRGVAYEVFEASRGCHLYFDLDGRSAGSISCESIACCVAEEATGVLRDLIAARAPAHIADGVMIETLTIESAHGGDKLTNCTCTVVWLS